MLTPLFRNMPHPALAAIVIAAMLHLSKPGYLRGLFARSRWEFAVAVIVIAGELTLGVLQGIALGVVLALLMLIYRTSHPQARCSANCLARKLIATSGGTPRR